ncbi:MAG: hypothetical protein LC118_08080 [Dehalococcoidia bacterium]|nr:hypothetical protein [Dehalococcoidia bacterium]
MLKKILAAVAAALTSPEAVKAEKSLAALVLVRLAITVPVLAGVIDIVVKALS